jgi:acetoacetyl-CoA synthetase
MRASEDQWQRCFPDYSSLYQWSIDCPEQFWASLWSFVEIRSAQRGDGDSGFGDVVLRHGDRMPGAQWFPQARLNFAENLLRRRDDAPALIFRGEDLSQRSLRFSELYRAVSQLRRQLQIWGLKPGDRVAGYLPNLPEAVVAMLAATSLGAIWSSCSPDFGVHGVVDRFGQIEPVVLFVADGYAYGGRWFDSTQHTEAICREIGSIRHVVVIPYAGDQEVRGEVAGSVAYRDAIAHESDTSIDFEPFPFDHPLYILYSSGTTGAPKCIVHGAGGTLLQHLKEHRLHVDLKPNDRLFYFTTCGWMMWNWLVSALASEATLLLYDGSPVHPDANVLFDFAQAEGANVFGTSAKFIDTLAKTGVEPRRSHDLSALKGLLSTGSPLAPESFDYVYSKIKEDLCLSSMSGGTDILSCFVAGNPIGPVWRGEIQARCLGVKVEVFDDTGRPVRGEKGELVMSAPLPSMPLGFWRDPGDERYRAAYFKRYPGVWYQGDFAMLTDHDGMIIYGRSDAVLNPGGVRIGTAEIYRQVDQIDEVLESLVIGQAWQGDVRVVLFVCLRDGVLLDEALRDQIRSRVREHASPRHTPARIIQVADIPRTRSGKIVELAVRDMVHGRPVLHRDALANPEALDLFVDLPELAD